MRPSNAVPTALHRAKSSASSLSSRLGTCCRRLVASARRCYAGVRTAVRGPIAGFVRGPLATHLLGRRAAVSVVLVGIAPVLAALTGVAVSTTTGYPPLERWVVDTWTGTDPRAAVFVGAALLVGLAATSAAANDGLLPTVLLTATPLFGAAVTRYGHTVETYAGERVVSLPDAVAFALGVAAVGSVAVCAVGYPLGVACRRAVRIVRAADATPV